MDNGKTIEIERPEGLGLEWEATGEWRKPVEGEWFLDLDADEATECINSNLYTKRIILRKRVPADGPWQEKWEWTGEVVYYEDMAVRQNYTADFLKWRPEHKVSHPNRRAICFILRPKAKPTLAERLREALPVARGAAIYIHWDKLYAIADDIEARERVVAEVVAEMREFPSNDRAVIHKWADRLEGKD